MYFFVSILEKMYIIRYSKNYKLFFYSFCGPEKDRFLIVVEIFCLLGAGVFGDSLCTFRYSVLSQFTGQQETNSCLDFPTGDG